MREPRGCITNSDAAKLILERLYPYIEAVNHIHLPDGDILYASEVWDALHVVATETPESLYK